MSKVGDRVRNISEWSYFLGEDGTIVEANYPCNRFSILWDTAKTKHGYDADGFTPIAPVAPEFHGHPRFKELMEKAIGMHDTKNYDYARGGNPLGNFQRVSAIKQLYKGLPWDTPTGTAIDYMLKQLDAALWMYAQGYEGETEGFEGRMMDVCVYSPLIIINKEEEKKK